MVNVINRFACYRSFSLKCGGPYQVFNRGQKMTRISNLHASGYMGSDDTNKNELSLVPKKRNTRHRQRCLSSWIDGREGMRGSPEIGLLKLFFLMILFVSGATAANAGRGEISLLAEPKKLPEIVFYDEANNPVTLDKWLGKVLILNIWATQPRG